MASVARDVRYRGKKLRAKDIAVLSLRRIAKAYKIYT